MSSIVFFSCSIFIDNLISGFDGPSYKLASTSEKKRSKNPCLRSSKEHSILNHITATTIWSELWLTEFGWSLSFRSVPWPKIVLVFTTKNVVGFEQHEIHWSGTVFISGTLTGTTIKAFWKIKVQISRYWFNWASLDANNGLSMMVAPSSRPLPRRSNVTTCVARTLIQTCQSFSWTVWKTFRLILTSNDTFNLLVFTCVRTSLASFQGFHGVRTQKDFYHSCFMFELIFCLWIHGALTGFHCGSHSSLISLTPTAFDDAVEDPIRIIAGDIFMTNTV